MGSQFNTDFTEDTTAQINNRGFQRCQRFSVI